MKNRVRWEEIDSSTYEDMAAVLLSRLYPRCRRIDGSGGDGGQDVLFPLPSGDEIFEMKSFTGRLKGSRRTQVKRSLANAAKGQPTKWHLVVPIDPTPGEETWFGELIAPYPFECDWLGKTWLDGRMAQHPDIARYFVDGSADEVVRLLTEMSREQAALAGGLPDALERLKALTQRVNEIDPYYGFVLTSQPDGSMSVAATPKYVGAEDDRPIRVSGTFRFQDDDEGRAAAAALKSALEYGTPVTLSGDQVSNIDIDAPGLPAGIDQIEQVTIGSPKNDDLPAAHFDLRAYDGDQLAAQLPLSLTERTSGAKGVVLTLADASDAITIALQVDVTERRFNLNYRFSQPKGRLPGQVLPAVDFYAALLRGHAITIAVDGTDTAPPAPFPNLDADDAGDLTGYLNVLKALERVQRRTHIYFPFPEQFTTDELRDLFTVENLLDGHTVAVPWDEFPIEVAAGVLEEMRAGPLGSDEGGALEDVTELTYTIGGNTMPLGPARRYIKGTVREWPDLGSDEDSSETVRIVLHPVTDNSLLFKLVAP